ncbi:hypothetical protein NA57DRAFT_56998 [Rhizodiscina lignyota]|uniref:Thioesterase domain-containing protein n=1 Tax=Rhizodiscina lignyota TaxID=1504668 RepID=A0A9P4IEJ8_9PEZI|nr:hypothetical protein NA57DRAFT_56998 [Rhizodiscina lignyota]
MVQIEVPADEEFIYFSQIPWCASLINAPGMTIFRHRPRGSLVNPRDRFTITTLGKTAQCILHHLTIYKEPPPRTQSAHSVPYSPRARIPEVTTFYELGEGSNGWVNIVHGGLQATLMDETAVELVTASEEKWDAYGYESHIVSGVTAGMNIRYLAAAKTPGIFAVTAKYGERDGKKVTIHVMIKDASGTAVAKGELFSIFLEPRL